MVLRDEELVERLLEVRGVTESKAEGLVEEYTDLETISWAVRMDKEYVQEEFLINPDFLYGELLDEGLWQPYYQRRRQLKIPERRQDYVERYLSGWRQAKLDDYGGSE